MNYTLDVAIGMPTQEQLKHMLQALNNKKEQEMYIIGSITPQNTFSFSDTPAIHLTEATARQEAERLAQRNPGKEFVYFKAIQGIKVEGLSRRVF